MLLSTSCATCPPDPPQALQPIPWPALPAPPETGIELAPDGRVAVPLDYWTELVGYIRTLDDVRAMLAREGRIVPETAKGVSVTAAPTESAKPSEP